VKIHLVDPFVRSHLAEMINKKIERYLCNLKQKT
jgi:hypothetical protein